MRGGLTRRTIVASALLALLVGGAFAVLARTIAEQRDSAAQATRSQQVIAGADALERLVLDLETGQRGFLMTREERFLEPWTFARATYAMAIADLEAIAGRVPAQQRRASEIGAAVDAYVREYSVPLVAAARRGELSGRNVAALDEGRQQVDAIRGQFDRFASAERALFAARDERADVDARRALVAATVGLAGSIALIVVFGAYLTRSVAVPVRRAAGMAGRLAGGDLSTRMPEGGVGEVGALARAFNTMGSSLETSRDELRRLAEEQAALRRVATLVAQAVPADELFEAVTREARAILGADSSGLVRYEADGTATVLSSPELESGVTPKGGLIDLTGDSAIARVLRTGRPAGIADYGSTTGPLAEMRRRQGLRSAVAAPIVVEGRLWGALAVLWGGEQRLSPGLEERLAQFTELVGTALANAQSRADLAASRARVVATADETRRRIERDLHDGAQQRLLHAVINLKLARRALDDAPKPALALLDDALQQADAATEELRELAHGILPTALDRGLNAGIDTLVSRMQMPVRLDVTHRRLPPALEATAYFIVAEALTNTAKHARATRAEVTVTVADGALRIVVRDDGIGGASVSDGSGLLGLQDRAAARDGRLTVESPRGGGTVVTAVLPVRPQADGSP